MKRLHPNDSIYLVDHCDIQKFFDLVNNNVQYSILLRKNAGGIVFQWRLTFDIFYYLHTPEEKQMIDSYKLLDNPLTAFIHQILVRNDDLKRFNKVYNPSDSLRLLVSTLIIKKIIQECDYLEVYESAGIVESNPFRMEENWHLIEKDEKKSFLKSYEIQKQMLRSLKHKFINEGYFDQIISSSIEQAKEIHHSLIDLR